MQATEGIGALKYIHFPIIQQEFYTELLMHLASWFIERYDFVKSTFVK